MHLYQVLQLAAPPAFCDLHLRYHVRYINHKTVLNAPHFQPKNEPSNNRMLTLTPQGIGLTLTDCLAEQQGEAIMEPLPAP